MKSTRRLFATILALALLLTNSGLAALADTVLNMPAALKIIDEEAFYGDTSIDKVVLSDKVTEIRARAFANSTLSEINLPDSLTFIDESAFDGPGKVKVTANKGTYAYEWAVLHHYLYEEPKEPAGEFNGHWYAFYDIGLTWDEASRYCANLGGHLATITSREEQAFIESLLSKGSKNNYWLGGYIDSGWKWVTGEAFDYSHWGLYEPNNHRGVETKIEIIRTAYSTLHTGDWNDLKDDGTTSPWEEYYGLENFGFICEWETNVKRTGTFKGHQYAIIESRLSPKEQEAYCSSLGGYLATITSQAEQDFVYSLVSQSGFANKDVGFGGSDYGSEGEWYWMNGEIWDYTHWLDNCPDNGQAAGGKGQDYLQFWGGHGDKWDDYFGAFDNYTDFTDAFICEWSNDIVNFSITHDLQGTVLAQGSTNGRFAMPGLMGETAASILKVASNYTWTVSASDTSWLSVEKKSNSECLLTVGAVENGRAYSTTLTFTVGGTRKYTVDVLLDKQNGSANSDFSLLGNAVYLEDGSIQLTPLDTWKSGAVWFNRQIDASDDWFYNDTDASDEISIQFDYYAGGGRDTSYGGADGFAVVFADRVALGEQGGYLGIPNGAKTCAVEFDAHPNTWDPNGKHIALVRESVSNHLTRVFDDRVDDGAWHKARVDYKNGVLTAQIDGSIVLKYEGLALDMPLYVGITAATGNGCNRHLVRNLNLAADGVDIPEPEPEFVVGAWYSTTAEINLYNTPSGLIIHKIPESSLVKILRVIDGDLFVLTESNVTGYVSSDRDGEKLEFHHNEIPAYVRVSGSFSQHDLTLGYGNTAQIFGTVSSENAPLTRVSLTIDGYNIENDPNDRYATVDLTGKGLTSIRLEDYPELSLNAAKPPLNTPGNYKVKLWAKAGDMEKGTHLDTLRVTVTGPDTSTLFGTVTTASGTPIVDVSVIIQESGGAAEPVGYTLTDENGQWSWSGLDRNKVYTVAYSHPDYTFDTTSTNPQGERVIGTLASAGGDLQIAFTLSQNGREVSSIVVGTAVDFTVDAPGASRVRLVVDGAAYEEYRLDASGHGQFSRTFSKVGVRQVAFQAMGPDNVEYGAASASKQLRITAADGSLNATTLTAPKGVVINGQTSGYTAIVNEALSVSWRTVEHADSYHVYLYTGSTRLWDEVLIGNANTSATIPGAPYDGEFKVLVMANGVGYNQSCTTVYLTVYRTGADLEIGNADTMKTSVLGSSFRVQVSSRHPDLYKKLVVVDPDGLRTETRTTQKESIFIIFHKTGVYSVKAIASTNEDFTEVTAMYRTEAVSVSVATDPQITSVTRVSSNGNTTGYTAIHEDAAEAMELTVACNYFASSVQIYDGSRLIATGTGTGASSDSRYQEFNCTIGAEYLTSGKHTFRIKAYYAEDIRIYSNTSVLIQELPYTVYSVEAVTSSQTLFLSKEDYFLTGSPEDTTGDLKPAGTAVVLLGTCMGKSYVKIGNQNGFVSTELTMEWDSGSEIIIQPYHAEIIFDGQKIITAGRTLKQYSINEYYCTAERNIDRDDNSIEIRVPIENGNVISATITLVTGSSVVTCQCEASYSNGIYSAKTSDWGRVGTGYYRVAFIKDAQEIAAFRVYMLETTSASTNLNSAFLNADKIMIRPEVASLSAQASTKIYEGQNAIISYLSGYGFTHFSGGYYKLAKNTHTVGYELATRFVFNEEGEIVPLFALVLRGSYSESGDSFDGPEWASNFTGVVDNRWRDTWYGFDEPARLVFLCLKSYIERELESDYISTCCTSSDYEDCKFWITGHSRGAGVGNLIAGSKFASKKRKDVCAYLFATPNVSTKAGGEMDNIKNFIISADMVPRIPLGDWDYKRYGLVYYISDEEISVYYKNKNDHVSSDSTDYIESFIKSHYRSRYDYAATLQDKMIAHINAGEKILSLKNALYEDLGGWETVSLFKDIILDVGMISEIHNMRYYAAWITNISSYS